MGNRNENTVEEKKQELLDEKERIGKEIQEGGLESEPDRYEELEHKIETLRWVQGLENEL